MILLKLFEGYSRSYKWRMQHSLTYFSFEVADHNFALFFFSEAGLRVKALTRAA